VEGSAVAEDDFAITTERGAFDKNSGSTYTENHHVFSVAAAVGSLLFVVDDDGLLQ
jgi:hypothetical protein